MVDFHRVSRFFAVVFSLLFPLVVISATNTLPGGSTSNWEAWPVGAIYQGSDGTLYSRMGSRVHGCSVDSSWIQISSYSPGGSSCGYTVQYKKTGGCGSGSQYDASSSSCVPAVPTCGGGQVLNPVTQQCQASCPSSGTALPGCYNVPASTFASGLPSSIIVTGCRYSVGSGNQFGKTGESSTKYTVCDLVSSGAVQDASTPSSTGPSPCPKGQVSGQVNGVDVCVKSASAGTPEKPVTESRREKATETTGTPPNATTKETTKETQTTSTGGGRVESTTKETTTTTAPDGNGGTTSTTGTKTETKDQDSESFCKENPTSPLCKEGKWGGTCGAFTCEGDAVQCAMAKEQHQRNCSLFETPTALSELGNQVAGGQDPQSGSVPSPSNASSVNISGVISSAASERVLSASCVPTTSISVLGTSVSLDLSSFCDTLAIAGNIVAAIASLIAIRIVGTA